VFAVRKLITPLFVLAFVMSSLTHSAPAEANHITCSILHFPLAAYAGDGIYSAYGYAQLNCNGTPTMSFIQVQVATNYQFGSPIATNQLTCYNEPNCATSTTPVCCYTAADYVHTRANGWWQDGHGNKITIPWTGWNCFNIGSGERPSMGVTPGALLALADTGGGSADPPKACSRPPTLAM